MGMSEPPHHLSSGANICSAQSLFPQDSSLHYKAITISSRSSGSTCIWAENYRWTKCVEKELLPLGAGERFHLWPRLGPSVCILTPAAPPPKVMTPRESLLLILEKTRHRQEKFRLLTHFSGFLHFRILTMTKAKVTSVLRKICSPCNCTLSASGLGTSIL